MRILFTLVELLWSCVVCRRCNKADWFVRETLLPKAASSDALRCTSLGPHEAFATLQLPLQSTICTTKPGRPSPLPDLLFDES